MVMYGSLMKVAKIISIRRGISWLSKCRVRLHGPSVNHLHVVFSLPLDGTFMAEAADISFPWMPTCAGMTAGKFLVENLLFLQLGDLLL
jgi:hypothetical protein